MKRKKKSSYLAAIYYYYYYYYYQVSLELSLLLTDTLFILVFSHPYLRYHKSAHVNQS